ncbi:hypothetical protein Lqui_1033 [Legionella quinlivanii]|uniref:Uncharacterized protein n=1 Tax=Legionella quinlivanii TaxID=45073 RepID=A0A0W0Y5E1_9GAMM|nr:hypothetical protein [Legionella quinlivanii]KTD52189.1 hypothetical protein Lqui_1033 [Legionella quinlivanii]SEF76192.1 hypothetical protein SAMN02746093_01020 [Legionella quinlivanii DSM 21216]STY12312.1 Uncharacterised protein [Legionella quinlivanii]
MYSFWKSRFIDKQYEHDVEFFLVNNVPCTRENCTSLVNKLSRANDRVELAKKKIVKESANATDKYTFSLNISSNLINKTLNSQQYPELIRLTLEALDSGLNAELDYGDHFEQFNSHIKAFYDFSVSHQLEKDSVLSDEIKTFVVAYCCLQADNMVFTLSRALSKEEAVRFQEYGDRCFPRLCSTRSFEKEVCNLDDAKDFADFLLQEIPLWRKNIETNKCLIPDAARNALTTANDMEKLAKKYSVIFSEQLRIEETRNEGLILG